MKGKRKERKGNGTNVPSSLTKRLGKGERGLTLTEAVEPLYIRDVKPRCGPYVACSITERAAGRTQSAYLIIRPQNLNRLMGERVSEQKA